MGLAGVGFSGLGSPGDGEFVEATHGLLAGAAGIEDLPGHVFLTDQVPQGVFVGHDFAAVPVVSVQVQAGPVPFPACDLVQDFVGVFVGEAGHIDHPEQTDITDRQLGIKIPGR